MNFWERGGQTVVGRITAPQNARYQSLKLVALYGKKDFADVIRDKNLHMRLLSWIIWVGPM